jgi:hypothetical protein
VGQRFRQETQHLSRLLIGLSDRDAEAAGKSPVEAILPVCRSVDVEAV